MIHTIWYVNELLGEVYEGNDRRRIAAFSDEAEAKKYLAFEIQRYLASPHWHPDWEHTEQSRNEKRRIAEGYFEIEKGVLFDSAQDAIKALTYDGAY